MVGTVFQGVSTGHIRQLRLLLRSGLNVNIKNEKGQNLLMAALEAEDPDKRHRMFKMLLRKGANVFGVDPTTGRDVLLWACVLNRPEEVKLILKEGMSGLDLCKRDNRGLTGLHYVAMNGNKEICKILCHAIGKVGLSVDVANDDGFTPYILAKRLGHTDCVDILLNDGHASTYQFDTAEYKTADNWSFEGQRERSNVAKRLKAQKVIALKTLGRMPQLHNAHFKPNNVKIIASKYEKNLVKSMYAGKVGRPWSAPNSAERQEASYRERLRTDLKTIYHAKALTKSKGMISHDPSVIFARENTLAIVNSDSKRVHIKIHINNQDTGIISKEPKISGPLKPTFRFSKSLPNLSTKDSHIDLSESALGIIRQKPPVNTMSLRYPASNYGPKGKTHLESFQIQNNNVINKEPTQSNVTTNISNLMEIMSEQRTASFRGTIGTGDRGLLPVDKDVATFIKSRKLASSAYRANPHLNFKKRSGLNVHMSGRRGKSHADDKVDGLAIIREDAVE